MDERVPSEHTIIESATMVILEALDARITALEQTTARAPVAARRRYVAELRQGIGQLLGRLSGRVEAG